MNKKAAGIRLLMLKGFCLALTLILAAGLFTAGAFAGSDCGEKCCCHSSPMNMNQSQEEPITLSADLCKGDPIIPCDLKSGQTSELPEFIPGSVGSNLTYSDAPMDTLADSFSEPLNLRSDAPYLFVRGELQSAPIYLQNLTFLI